MKIRVDPRKVRRVEMRDGASYPVGRNGLVHIDHPRHEAEMGWFGDSDGGATGFVLPSIGAVRNPGKTCACGFAAWSWQTVCPRCGADL